MIVGEADVPRSGLMMLTVGGGAALNETELNIKTLNKAMIRNINRTLLFLSSLFLAIEIIRGIG
jgi:hypothetical protein